MALTFEGHGLGYIPDLGDIRDWRLTAPSGPPPTLPSSVDLRPQCPPLYDQGAIGSCTANASSALFRFVDKKQGGLDVNPSRLFVYYEARRMQGWETIDSGAYIRDAMKVLADLGAAPEETWVYDVARFKEKPPAPAYAQGLAHQALAYLRVNQDLDAMRGCLASGFPFVIGASLYENFMSGGSSGNIPMPSGSTSGGHAFMVVGYRDSDRRFICQNSWGERVHDHGYFYIPYDYLRNANLASDLWTLKSVEEVTVPEPEPDDLSPVIVGKPKYKHKSLVVVNGVFDPKAAIFLDGRQIAAVAKEGQFKFEQPGLTGVHTIRVVNPDGDSVEKNFVAKGD
jgi:C1A family cysteine protease